MKIPLPKNFKPKQPPIIHDFQEIAFSLFSPQIQPHLITLDNLKQKQIIPENWQLVKPSQPLPRGVKEFFFKQGLKIVIISGKIRFACQLGQNQIQFVSIISNFIYNFPQFTIYKNVINLRRLISLPGDKNVAKKFIKETILHQGEWQNFHNLPMRAEVSFLYNFNNTNLIIALTDLMISTSTGKIKSALLFKGTYNYLFNHRSKIINLQRLETAINNYQHNIDTFNYIINQVFLGKS